MKTLNVVLVVAMLGLTTSVQADVHDSKVTNVVKTGVSFAVVDGRVGVGKLWLGISYKCSGKAWVDATPVRVDGFFRQKFLMEMCFRGYDVVRACLWKGAKNKMVKGKLSKGRISCLDRK